MSNPSYPDDCPNPDFDPMPVKYPAWIESAAKQIAKAAEDDSFAFMSRNDFAAIIARYAPRTDLANNRDEPTLGRAEADKPKN